MTLFKTPRKDKSADSLPFLEHSIRHEPSPRQIAVLPTAADRRPKTFPPSDSDYGRILDLPVAEIAPNPSQPRETFDDESILRLADSIRLYGILQPLTVRLTEHPPFPCDCDITDEDPSEKPRYELVAGERRLRAAKLLGFVNVPCLLVNVDARRSAELAIIENLQRENLNIFEQASSIASLIDIYHLTQEEAARQLSMSQSFVANKLRILRLTSPERDRILKGGLTERHARALLKVDSAEQRLKIIDYIIAHNLNVSTTEAYIDRYIAESELIRRANAPRKIILKDIRLFYNSIDKAVSIVRQAGIDIDSSRTESDNETVVTIRIPKKS